VPAVVWEDPPEASNGQAQYAWWASIAHEARKRPGKWLRVPGDHSPSVAYDIRYGRRAAFSDGQWEVTTRKLEDRRHLMWLRYLGP
jgi:hypothetical protein